VKKAGVRKGGGERGRGLGMGHNRVGLCRLNGSAIFTTDSSISKSFA
jgi:hypothetical protein